MSSKKSSSIIAAAWKSRKSNIEIPWFREIRTKSDSKHNKWQYHSHTVVRGAAEKWV